MCETGLLIASLALSAAGAAAQQVAQSQAASQQAAYQEAQMRAHNEAIQQNSANAIKEQVEQTAAERTKQMQDAAVAAREQQKNQIDYLQKKGTAQASSPYGAGLSFDALMADFSRAYARNSDVIDEQLKMQGMASDINVRGYRDRAQARLDSQQGYIPAPINNGNSFLASALGFAGDAFGAYNSATNYGKDSLFDTGAPNDPTGSTWRNNFKRRL